MGEKQKKRWDLEWVLNERIHIDHVDADKYQVVEGIGLFHSLLPDCGVVLVASVPADKVVVAINTNYNNG